MNPTMAAVILITYYAAMLVITTYSVFQFFLAISYLRSKRRHARVAAPPDHWPLVTIQLPVYNELYVIERLMDAVGAIDYPKEKLQIQLIDDSTDESAEVGRRKVEELHRSGLTVEHIRRTERTSFKAGALQHALASATGEFIAIFDADFVPRPDFLKKTMPSFTHEKIGAVQTRWGHLNRDYSVLTRLQALALDLHFSVEQRGRNANGCFINFNGTAGVWRKQAIVDAGGWRDITLTEDLDLSYRAQLRGWKFLYLEDVVSPAELPVEINALKSQQFRWNKGGAETARLMLPAIARTKLPLRVKLHAVAHLLNSSVYVFVLLSTILSVPFLFAHAALPDIDLTLAYGFLTALALLSFAYLISFVGRGRSRQYVFEYPTFLSLSLGLSLHNSIAVLKGFFGGRSAFIRTPKFNISGTQSWHRNKYLRRQIKPLTWLEGGMAIYLAAGVVAGFRMGYYGMIPFHIMATIGFAVVFFFSIRHSLQAPRL